MSSPCLLVSLNSLKLGAHTYRFSADTYQRVGVISGSRCVVKFRLGFLPPINLLRCLLVRLLLCTTYFPFLYEVLPRSAGCQISEVAFLINCCSCSVSFDKVLELNVHRPLHLFCLCVWAHPYISCHGFPQSMTLTVATS